MWKVLSIACVIIPFAISLPVEEDDQQTDPNPVPMDQQQRAPMSGNQPSLLPMDGPLGDINEPSQQQSVGSMESSPQNMFPQQNMEQPRQMMPQGQPPRMIMPNTNNPRFQPQEMRFQQPPPMMNNLRMVPQDALEPSKVIEAAEEERITAEIEDLQHKLGDLQASIDEVLKEGSVRRKKRSLKDDGDNLEMSLGKALKLVGSIQDQLQAKVEILENDNKKDMGVGTETKKEIHESSEDKKVKEESSEASLESNKKAEEKKEAHESETKEKKDDESIEDTKKEVDTLDDYDYEDIDEDDPKRARAEKVRAKDLRHSRTRNNVVKRLQRPLIMVRPEPAKVRKHSHELHSHELHSHEVHSHEFRSREVNRGDIRFV